ncbi:MAG: thioredoxin family protein [Planctomycetota bacterium]
MAHPRRIFFPTITLALGLLATHSFAEVRWHRDTDAALRKASQTQKPILVFVTAKWCHFCDRMKNEVWADPQICEVMRDDFEVLQLDGDNDRATVSRLPIEGYPTTFVFDSRGQLITKHAGFLPADRMETFLRLAQRQ